MHCVILRPIAIDLRYHLVTGTLVRLMCRARLDGRRDAWNPNFGCGQIEFCQVKKMFRGGFNLSRSHIALCFRYSPSRSFHTSYRTDMKVLAVLYKGGEHAKEVWVARTW